MQPQIKGIIVDRASFHGIALSVLTADDRVAYSAHYGDGQHNLTLDEYRARSGKESAELVSNAEFDRMVKHWVHETFLDHPADVIDEQTFDQALGALPPKNWHFDRGIERFMIAEMTFGSITLQYARLGDQFRRRHVDAGDSSTWIGWTDFQ